ncbi:MAG: flagellar motor protein MotB [Sediminibacterium sp.]|nr:MAG: flagellar motor protein MotB [Sediminibacterium sp.] [Sediminibacterium sp. FEMGT703S]
MKRVVLILFAFGFYSCLFAQQYNPDKVNQKALALYDKAIGLLKEDELKKAVPILLECIQMDTNFVDAYLSIAGVFGELKQYKRSIQFYEIGKAKDPVYFMPYYLPYSINLAGDGNFEAALLALNRFLENPKLNDKSIRSAAYRKKTYQFALDYAAKNKELSNYYFAPENLGDSVNSAFSEYYPSVTVTDSLLVFTRRGKYMREDFFSSSFIAKQFSKAVPIGGDINEEPQKGAITVSQDGEWMLFAGRFAERGYDNFDLYIAYATPQGWSDPENLGPAINTEFWESAPSLSPDKRTLYFSSNRPGGFGGKDLYYSERLANGKWTPAKNMGPQINTAGDDQAPFIHADNQTLYFTSDGHPGYGGTDLFIIRKNDQGSWGIPENLGYPINTIENEGSLAVSADGLTAYYASDRAEGKGELDLYRFSLRNNIRPIRTLYLKGVVTDKSNGNKLPSSVELINNADQSVLMKIQTDETGMYFITLPVGRDYTFSVNRKGYLPFTELYSLAHKEADSVYVKNIALQPLAINASFTFKNIEFASNASILPETAAIELNKLVALLNENSTLQVQISGHTDNTGNEVENKKLSANRALSIVNFLIEKGISKNRLAYKGYGSSLPITSNDTPEGRARNRRTSVEITKL